MLPFTDYNLLESEEWSYRHSNINIPKLHHRHNEPEANLKICQIASLIEELKQNWE